MHFTRRGILYYDICF